LAELKLAAHQLAWLEQHPYRTEAWLRAMLADGFDIHHADMNHENNERGNLVLIEATDHKSLHGGNINRERRATGTRLTDEARDKGQRIYEAKKDGISWRSAAIAAGLLVSRYSDPNAYKRLADAYALGAGLPMHVHRPAKNRTLVLATRPL